MTEEESRIRIIAEKPDQALIYQHTRDKEEGGDFKGDEREQREMLEDNQEGRSSRKRLYVENKSSRDLPGQLRRDRRVSIHLSLKCSTFLPSFCIPGVPWEQVGTHTRGSRRGYILREPEQWILATASRVPLIGGKRRQEP